MKLFLSKLRCNEITFNCGAAAFFTVALNCGFLLRAWQTLSFYHLRDYLYAASIPVVLFCAFMVIFNVMALPWLRKPLLAILIIASAAANYFMFNFGTVIDTNMIQNVFETDMQEASALLSVNYLIWLLLLGALPVAVMFLCRIKNNRPWWLSAAWRVLTSLAALLLIVLVAAFFYKDYASMFRNNKGLVKMVTPANVVNGIGYYVNSHWFSRNQELIAIGLDAKKGKVITGSKKKTLVVFVLGETARAENFSLGGYTRETNPKLQRDNVIYYQHATSCGTETAISVPCMFSNMSRQNYDASLARHQEGLLDVMAHAGINVLWRENDGGCKGACNRVPHSDMTKWQVSELCRSDYCLDDVLLHRLNYYIDSIKDDSVIVLHQMGSHGPAYYLRYPPEARQFTPTCDSNQIQNCDRQTLINTYDNTILYTDTMLDNTINLLKSYNDKFNVAMIYLSDHGESLGERGMYLHGTPYLFAPSQQTHIPFLLWMSPDYATTFGIDRQCLQQQAKVKDVSQDNLFHTLLGMMDIETQEYKPALDMIRSCRNQG
ncbi:phosphoethanolamine transferase EptA [Erwinia pyrifoliae]|uniref:Phosphoethanolamine transferase EptA n=1 Tax=Erwinia pyrifoliae TaxID=79967 RepID=A0ABY5XCZ7_ERWPY|nr:phosphoethanolamine transferase EptA [Erwinia pyrifoliae]AUX72630.1 phosphoethanolamine transferase EptA [Erwinia pyrifoliae]MCA8877108.1 phosphoethanolamine transferase EptA [Erwinia pyrifoliae]MCT2387257.1 phosphoethanolamine transferase EptA [Erwinia pyrifoliae]MCU8587143.1 phosphoethanolamine transferase EptA [Erwinia pyrifoliae]UWS31004.1 phosphoethanolamine transferase EptA [Erwinia pyrifoliae]